MLRIGGQTLAPTLVVFDKDGTLIAFDDMWHAWYERLLTSLSVRLTLTPETHLGLAGTLGYGVKSFFGYLRTQQKYQLNLTRSL